MGLGWLRFQVEERGEKLYVPQNSQAMDDQEFARDNFGRSTRIVEIFYVNDNPRLDLNNRNALLDMFDLYEGVENQVDNAKLGEICIRSSNGNCAIQSPLGFWEYDLSKFLADTNWIQTMSVDNVPDFFSSSDSLLASNIFGEAVRNENGSLLEIGAFKVL